jgi:predicted nucleic acid-binding Zn ribbon protein
MRKKRNLACNLSTEMVYFKSVTKRLSLKQEGDSSRWRNELAFEPEKVGGLIGGFLERLGLAERLSLQSAVILWPEIAGPRIAEESEAVKIDGDTLIIKVYKAAWRQQLTFLKAELLAKLESKIGKGVKDIRFI